MIVEQTKHINKTEARQMALSNEGSKLRGEKESKYWSLVQKLHKEKDNNNRLEKRIRSKQQQVEELKQKTDINVVFK